MVLSPFEKSNHPFQGNSKWTWAIALKERPDAIIGSISLWKREFLSTEGLAIKRALEQGTHETVI